MISFMLERKSSRPRWDARRRRYLANPLWPLEELRDLRDPLFVADPEFTSFKIDALRSDLQTSGLASRGVRQARRPAKSKFYRFRREFSIPPLVTGLPWRYDRQINPPPVPEAELTRIDLSYIGDRPHAQINCE